LEVELSQGAFVATQLVELGRIFDEELFDSIKATEMFERVLEWYQRLHGLEFVAFRYFNAAGATPAKSAAPAHYDIGILEKWFFDGGNGGPLKYTPEQMAITLDEIGLDLELTLRKDGHITPEKAPDELPAMVAALATLIARRISARLRPPVKVLVLDADNTLWGGVCGEESPAALQMDGSWRDMRNFAAGKRNQGILLCLCSKNQPEDVDRVFVERANDLILTKEQFSGWKVNWNPKSQNIRELADELNLGMDSFVFLDDNPAEVAEVSANCPGVLALTLPETPEAVSAFLQHLWPLDASGQTSADASRADFYRQESERRELQKTTTSFADFLRGLDLKVEIKDASAEDLPRIAQLTKRTNQFNANPLRLSEQELLQRIDSGSTCLSVHVADRFGDYGLVGMILYQGHQGASELAVELFQLSCRAMGKGVERAMVIALGKRALELGSGTVSVIYSATDRNEPCRRFFEELGGFTIDARAAAGLSPVPERLETSPSLSEKPADRPAPHGPLFESEVIRLIATTLSDPEALHRQLTSSRRPRPDLSQAFVKPGTTTQEKLAAIWREVLGIEEIGLEDPFSALGGSSIQLVQLPIAHLF
ncbi:MAG: HAD-IIIC family phosphatase, partial [Verrucomicrobiales bacterium]